MEAGNQEEEKWHHERDDGNAIEKGLERVGHSIDIGRISE